MPQAYIQARVVRGELSRWARVEVRGVCDLDNPCGVLWIGECDEYRNVEEWKGMLGGFAAMLCSKCWEALDHRRLQKWAELLSRECKKK